MIICKLAENLHLRLPYQQNAIHKVIQNVPIRTDEKVKLNPGSSVKQTAYFRDHFFEF